MATTTRRQIIERIFNDFALDTRDVAQEYDLTMRQAYDILRGLEQKGVLASTMVNGHEPLNRSLRGKMNPGMALTWQCWKTYDNHTVDEVISDAVSRGVDLDSPVGA